MLEQDVDQLELLRLADGRKRGGAVQRPVLVVHGRVGCRRTRRQQQLQQARVTLLHGRVHRRLAARSVLHIHDVKRIQEIIL